MSPMAIRMEYKTMSDSSQKTALIIGTVAAAAGVAIATYIIAAKLKDVELRDTPELRSINDLLSECYNRIDDMQDHLSDVKDVEAAS